MGVAVVAAAVVVALTVLVVETGLAVVVVEVGLAAAKTPIPAVPQRDEDRGDRRCDQADRHKKRLAIRHPRILPYCFAVNRLLLPQLLV